MGLLDNSLVSDDTANRLGGLLGTPDDLQQILSLLSPSQADKDAARNQGLLALGFGLMGARRGFEWQQAGNAGLNAMQAQQNYLQNLAQQRAVNMQNVTGAVNLAQMLAMRRAMMQVAAGQAQPVTNGVQPEAGVSPKTAAQFGGQQAGFSNLPPAPLSVPPGTDPTQINGFTPPNWRQQMPPDVRSMLMFTDPKTLLENVREYGATKNGPNGVITSYNGQPLYQPTPTGIQYFNADGTPGRFVATTAQNAAVAAQAGAVKQAESRAGATVQTGEYTLPSGAKVPVNSLELADYLSGKGPVPSTLRGSLPEWMPGANGAPQNSSIPPSAASSPGDANLAANTSNPFAGPNPVAQATAQEFARQTIGTGAKQLEDLQAKRPAAISVLSGLDNLERMDQRGVFNGPAQNKYMTAAIWVNSMLPGANLDVQKITDSQAYDAALKTLSRANLKQFGGRVTNQEFVSGVLQSLPERMSTPEARAEVRDMIGRGALDELNQVNSAERFWNPNNGLVGWNPPSPVAAGQYWTSRMRIQNLQPAPNLNSTARYQVQQVLRAGRPQDIRDLVLSGALQ